MVLSWKSPRIGAAALLCCKRQLPGSQAPSTWSGRRCGRVLSSAQVLLLPGLAARQEGRVRWPPAAQIWPGGPGAWPERVPGAGHLVEGRPSFCTCLPSPASRSPEASPEVPEAELAQSGPGSEGLRMSSGGDLCVGGPQVPPPIKALAEEPRAGPSALPGRDPLPSAEPAQPRCPQRRRGKRGPSCTAWQGPSPIRRPAQPRCP